MQMDDDGAGLAAGITERVQRIVQQLLAPMDSQRHDGDAGVQLAGSMHSQRAVAAVEEFLQNGWAPTLQCWPAKQQVASMHAAGTPRMPQLPAEVLRVLLQEQPALLKPLAGSCTDGYITAMQQAPTMVLHIPAERSGNGSKADDDMGASFLPLVHARMVGATEFKVVVSGRYDRVEVLTAAYDAAARQHGVLFERVHTLNVGGMHHALPALHALAAYMPNLQRVFVETIHPSHSLSRFLGTLQPLEHLRVLRIVTQFPSPAHNGDDCSVDIARGLAGLSHLEQLELGFELDKGAQLPPGLKQLVGRQLCNDGHITAYHKAACLPYLRLWPSMTESLCCLAEAHMCMLEVPSCAQPTAQQLRVLRAMDASCALLLMHSGRPVPAADPAAVTAAETAYVWLESHLFVEHALQLASFMLPRLRHLWVMSTCPNDEAWQGVLTALRTGIIRPAVLHTAGRQRFHASGAFAALVAWCAANGVAVVDTYNEHFPGMKWSFF